MSAPDMSRFIREVIVPGGMEAAAWAEQQSAEKAMAVPEGWPESRYMCLMYVIRVDQNFADDSETRAYLVTRPEAMHWAATHHGYVKLWFKLPRRLFTPQVCPDLKPEDWPPEEQSP